MAIRRWMLPGRRLVGEPRSRDNDRSRKSLFGRRRQAVSQGSERAENVCAASSHLSASRAVACRRGTDQHSGPGQRTQRCSCQPFTRPLNSPQWPVYHTTPAWRIPTAGCVITMPVAPRFRDSDPVRPVIPSSGIGIS